MCVCVCVCEREGEAHSEIKRERMSVCENGCVHILCVCTVHQVVYVPCEILIIKTLNPE